MKRGCHFHPTTDSLFQFSSLLFSNFTSTAATRPLYVVTHKRFCVQHESERRVSKKRKDNCPQKHNKLSCSSAQIKSEKYMYHNATGSHHQSTKMGEGGGIKHATKVHDFAQRKTLLRLFNSKTRTKDEPHIHTYRQKKTHKSNNKKG